MVSKHPLLLLLLLLCQQLHFGTAHKILVRSQNGTDTKTQHWLKLCRYIQPLMAVRPLNYVRKKLQYAVKFAMQQIVWHLSKIMISRIGNKSPP